MYYNMEGSQSDSALIIEANMKFQEKNHPITPLILTRAQTAPKAAMLVTGMMRAEKRWTVHKNKGFEKFNHLGTKLYYILEY